VALLVMSVLLAGSDTLLAGSDTLLAGSDTLLAGSDTLQGLRPARLWHPPRRVNSSLHRDDGGRRGRTRPHPWRMSLAATLDRRAATGKLAALACAGGPMDDVEQPGHDDPEPFPSGQADAGGVEERIDQGRERQEDDAKPLSGVRRLQPRRRTSRGMRRPAQGNPRTREGGRPHPARMRLPLRADGRTHLHQMRPVAPDGAMIESRESRRREGSVGPTAAGRGERSRSCRLAVEATRSESRAA
jgi:hypothetical protein